uniref:Uncharacterized protein n=1 Tax=Romanomermis culicivorax TaxID=13658 RepID=A0A915K7B9_ROMCU
MLDKDPKKTTKAIIMRNIGGKNQCPRKRRGRVTTMNLNAANAKNTKAKKRRKERRAREKDGERRRKAKKIPKKAAQQQISYLPPNYPGLPMARYLQALWCHHPHSFNWHAFRYYYIIII